MSRPLRILMIQHMPWSRELGGARVQVELADEFRKRGHSVEKFDLFDAYGGSPPAGWRALFRPAFHRKAIGFVRRNAHRFDLIDAHQGNLPASKKLLGFTGLLVARSVGLYAFYDGFAGEEKKRWPRKSRGTLAGHLFRSAMRLTKAPDYARSLAEADLVNLCNADEVEWVSSHLRLGDKCVNLPFGLTPDRLEAFRRHAGPPAARLAGREVVFIGAWGLRKGGADWPAIVRRLRAAVPGVRFLFLGTHAPAEKVLGDLEVPDQTDIRVVPHYASDDLPRLVKDSAAAAFPSYIEGFPFAVLEKLAAGLPTVAYDVPGSRELLQKVDPSLLTPVGDPGRLVERLAGLLTAEQGPYSKLADDCRAVTLGLRWDRIAESTLAAYEDALSLMSRKSFPT